MLSGLRGGLKTPRTRRQGSIYELPDFGHVLRYKAIPVSRFNGSNTYAHLRSLDAAQSILAVWRKTTATFSDFHQIISCRKSPNGNKTGDSDENILMGGVSGANAITNSTDASSNTQARHDGIDITETDLINFRTFNVGYDIGSATSWHYTWQFQESLVNTKNWCIGADTFSTGRYLTGEIAEIIIYPTILSLNKILDIEEYVKTYISII